MTLAAGAGAIRESGEVVAAAAGRLRSGNGGSGHCFFSCEKITAGAARTRFCAAGASRFVSENRKERRLLV
jgi:hypothetical protein